MKERFILKNKTNVFCRVKSLFGVVLLLTIFYSNYSSAQNLKDITLDREWNKRIIPVYDYVVVFSLPKSVTKPFLIIVNFSLKNPKF